MRPIRWMLFLAIVAFGCNPSVSNAQTQLDPDAFEKLVNTDENVQLVDVRTPQEVAGGYIAKAVNLNISDPDFKARLAKLDKNKPVAVYCAVGGRSGRAASMLTEMGFTKVYNLAGGINAWNAKGKKLTK